MPRGLQLTTLLTGTHSAFIFGPRGVGKTSLCLDYLNSVSHTYCVNLLEYSVFSRYVTHPELFAKQLLRKQSHTKAVKNLSADISLEPSLI